MQQIDEMSRTVEGLKLENEMLRKFLLRCEQAAKRVVEKVTCIPIPKNKYPSHRNRSNATYHTVLTSS